MRNKDKWPDRWGNLLLEDVVEKISNGVNLPQLETAIENSFPISRIETIANETIDFNRVKHVIIDEDGLKKYSLLKGDILFSHINSDKHLGKTAIFEGEKTLIHGVNLLLIRANSKFNKKLLNYLFKHYRFQGKFIEVAQRAVNQSSINQKKLKSFVVPFIDSSEQQRIVAKLDALFGHLDSLREKLDRIPELLKNFRQQVLTQAVTGELTKEWREGKELQIIALDAIEEERKKLKLEQAINRGKKSIKYKESVKLDLGGKTKGINEFFTLPDSWQWVPIDKVVWNVSDGPHFSPNYIDNKLGKRFISARNIKYSGIDFSDCKYVSDEDHFKFIERGVPEKGDIILTKGGTTGIACITDSDSDFSYWVHLALLKPIKKFISPKYLRDALTSGLLYKQSQELTHGVSNQDLGLTRLIYIALPLPSLEEQVEIVNKVESLFRLADKIEAQYQSLKAKIDQMPQAILSKAFRGELVEQEVKEYEVEVGEGLMAAEQNRKI